MTNALTDLHMVKLRLRTLRLFGYARAQHLPLREVDAGYLVHTVLTALFDGQAPGPFRIVSSDRSHSTVIAYSGQPGDALSQRAQAFADPEVFEACEWPLMSKPLPRDWPIDMRLRFEVRCCPVTRMAASGVNHRSGAEVDAFLAECWGTGDERTPVSREAVYVQWLGREFERRGGARVIQAELCNFRIARLLRRSQGPQRKLAICPRPDATLRGMLQVTDGPAFAALLRRGLGRHRAFGFGMLCVKPAA